MLNTATLTLCGGGAAGQLAGRSSRQRPRAVDGRSARQQRGVVHVWTVLITLIIIGFVGLAIDVSYGVLVAGQLQNAADAASLAAVAKVSGNQYDARQQAALLALANKAGGEAVQLSLNEGNAADGDIVLGIYDRDTGVFTPTLTNPNAVKVIARRTGASLGGALPLFFGPVFGIDTVDIQREAIAMMGGGTGAGLISLSETDEGTFRLSGSVRLDVYDTSVPGGIGAIQINSADHRALRTDGSPTLIASDINVNADWVDDPPEFAGNVNTGRPRVGDPLAGIAPPADWGVDQGTFSVAEGTYYLQPGYYPDGISMTGGSVSLAPGVYVLDGEGLKIVGGDLLGDGVMLYIVDTTPSDDQRSSVMLAGNGNISITPMPLEQTPYGGIAIWQEAGNINGASLRGTGQFTGIDGTLYFPTADVGIMGTSDSFGIRQLISNSVGISGNGTVAINYDGRNPAPGTRGFLVK